MKTFFLLAVFTVCCRPLSLPGLISLASQFCPRRLQYWQKACCGCLQLTGMGATAQVLTSCTWLSAQLVGIDPFPSLAARIAPAQFVSTCAFAYIFFNLNKLMTVSGHAVVDCVFDCIVALKIDEKCNKACEQPTYSLSPLSPSHPPLFPPIAPLSCHQW